MSTRSLVHAPARAALTPRLAGCALAFVCATCSAGAIAALGSDAASVEADRAALEATASPAMPSPGYSVVELRAPSGTVVREFLSTSGKVFAVAWAGPALPDLKQLLGAYFDAYTAALRTQPSPGVGRAEVRAGELVVQSAGQMRNFFGRAYLPALLPQGVATDEIN